MLFIVLVLVAAAAAAIWSWDRRRAPPPAAAPMLAIAGAAIRYSDLGTMALPLPKSHDDVRELVERTHGRRAGKHPGEIGYITNRGGFVKSHEALVIARQARQLRRVPLRGDVLELDYLHKPVSRGSAARPAARRAPLFGRLAQHASAAAWMTQATSSGQLATPEHIYRELVRTATVTVPCLLLAGSVSLQFGAERFGGMVLGALNGGGDPARVWPLSLALIAMYALLGLALALVIHARGARMRGPAVAACSTLVVAGLLWGFSFEAQVHGSALILAALLVVAAPVTVVLFGWIRVHAGILAVPVLGWSGLAAYSTLQAYFGI